MLEIEILLMAFALLLVLSNIQKGESRSFFNTDIDSEIQAGVTCALHAATNLFNPNHRIVILYKGHEEIANEIVKAFTNREPILISNRPMYLENDRIPSYIVVDYSNFSYSRELFSSRDSLLYREEFLFLTNATEEVVKSYTNELWEIGFRDIVFSRLDNKQKWTLLQPEIYEKEVRFVSLGYCTPTEKKFNEISKYSMNIYRFCDGNCQLRHGKVVDETTFFWRTEDTVKFGNSSLHGGGTGTGLVKHFGKKYNFTIPVTHNINYSWPEAAKRLLSGELDIISTTSPLDIDLMKGLEVVCWYRTRYVEFAAQVEVHFTSAGNDIMKIFLPFRILVWLSIACVSLLYILITFALRKLYSMGLIRENMEFMDLLAISLSQSISIPKKFSLRLILLLWIILSLYLSIIYNSTFTSSMAQVYTKDLLENLEELLESGKSISGPNGMQIYLNESDDQVMKDLAKRYIVTTSEEAVRNIFAKSGAAMLQRHTVDRVNWAMKNNRSLPLYTIPNARIEIPVYFITRKGHPYCNAIRIFMTYFNEQDLIARLSAEYLVIEKGSATLPPVSDDILTMTHLDSVFEIFLLFLGLSCIVFFLELLYAYDPLKLFKPKQRSTM